jgi:tetratricopeptide (TPR) repeat protein
MKTTWRAIVVAAAVVAGATPAAAQNAKAEALFKKGKKLLEEGKYADACAAFEASQRAEATIGTRLNIGLCYEQWGKLATAYKTYLKAQEEAEGAGDDRAPRIAERAAELEPKVPTLIIRAVAEAKPVDLIVRLDAKDLPLGELDKPRRLDPGEHIVEYGVGDSKRKRIKVKLEPGDHEEVMLEKLAQMGAGGPVEEDLDDDRRDRDQLDAAPDPGRTRRRIGVVSGVVGLASIGVSSYLVITARSDYREAKAAHCNEMNQCDALGLQVTRDARSKANLGTVFFGIGAAALGAGVILYLTAPEARRGEARDREDSDEEPEPEEEALRLTPVVGPDAAGFVLAGTF